MANKIVTSKILIILFFGVIVGLFLKNVFFSAFFFILLLLVVYRNYILTKKYFSCLRCGKCCRLKVEPSKEDIKRIESAGYKDFLLNKKDIKKVNGNCIFIKIENGLSTCTINDIKPELCKKWPISKGLFGKEVDIRCAKLFKG